jgi:alpha-glucoside transport system substrate-binding protein
MVKKNHMRIDYTKLLFLGMILIILSVPLQACKNTPSLKKEKIGTVSVLGIWDGAELESFKAMVAPWEEKTGGTMAFSGIRDLISVLTVRLEAGNPPDVAILPNPGQMVELAKKDKLIYLDSFLDMNKINQQYSQTWLDLGSRDGHLYGIFMRANSKSTVWYNPNYFTSHGWSVPNTWDEMINLSDRIVSEGKSPWSVGLESDESSGWPATDWIGEILLHESGGDVYDQWVNHEIPWTDSRIKSSWEKFGHIVLTDHYIQGGPKSALSTNFAKGSYLLFEDPPRAAMFYLGAFTEGFIREKFPQLVAGKDYAFFPFPAIDPRFAGSVTGGADVVVLLNDSPASRSFVKYLVSAESQKIWVKRGGFTSVNNQVGLNEYPNPLARSATEQLVNARLFRFDADDSMPSRVQKAFWEGTLAYLQAPSQLNTILAKIEAVAAEAY